MSTRTRPPRQSSPGHGARFRSKGLPIADGGSLVLRGDGTIERRDAAGATVERLTAGDPAWADLAIRFGVRASPATVVPRGRDVPGNRPPV